jgi:hypothetical protein
VKKGTRLFECGDERTAPKRGEFSVDLAAVRVPDAKGDCFENQPDPFYAAENRRVLVSPQIQTTCLALLLLANVGLGQDNRGSKPTLVLEPGGHTSPAYGLAFTPDGKELISLARDDSIRFWNNR